MDVRISPNGSSVKESGERDLVRLGKRERILDGKKICASSRDAGQFISLGLKKISCKTIQRRILSKREKEQ